MNNGKSDDRLSILFLVASKLQREQEILIDLLDSRSPSKRDDLFIAAPVARKILGTYDEAVEEVLFACAAKAKPAFVACLMSQWESSTRTTDANTETIGVFDLLEAIWERQWMAEMLLDYIIWVEGKTVLASNLKEGLSNGFN